MKVMNSFKEILHDIGFSKDLIDAINDAPQLESQTIDIDNAHYQTFENDITSSTEINMSDCPNTYNYYGDDVEHIP